MEKVQIGDRPVPKSSVIPICMKVYYTGVHKERELLRVRRLIARRPSHLSGRRPTPYGIRLASLPYNHRMEANWNTVLNALISKQDLTSAQMRWVMEEIMQGYAGEAETASFLTGMRMKGERAAEIAEAASILRKHMIRWDTGRTDVLDTCGTGGDASGTFNISTATAIVVAAAGVPVVKHGNRSVSSRSGSADVLATLGVSLEGTCERAFESLNRIGLAFCFAPHFHPALKHVGPVRKKLGFPTLFNCLGPLANPAGAQHQLLGVGRLELLDLLAEALNLLGTQNAFVVHGVDGLDEVTLSGPTLVRRVSAGKVDSLQWHPSDFGLREVALAEVRVAGPEESAQLLVEIVQGKDGPPQRLVLANAAAGLLAASRVKDLRDGVAMARHAIESGKAAHVLDQLRGRVAERA